MPLRIIFSIAFSFLSSDALYSQDRQLARVVEANGFRTHQVRSEFQEGQTSIRVLLPDSVDPKKKYRVLYVLPVVERARRRFGDGLMEIKKLGLHNRYQLICVAPEFTRPPWFADHDQESTERDESHFLKVVLPIVEKEYPVMATAKGRLLIGFSKSGWGAFSLLLRHPDLFHRAAGWDSGIRVDVGPIEPQDQAERIARIFGSNQNFERYRLSNLLRKNGVKLGKEARLFYYNTAGKRAEGGAKLHQLMIDQQIAHRYLFEPKRAHRWDSGWMPTAMDFLVRK